MSKAEDLDSLTARMKELCKKIIPGPWQSVEEAVTEALKELSHSKFTDGESRRVINAALAKIGVKLAEEKTSKPTQPVNDPELHELHDTWKAKL